MYTNYYKKLTLITNNLRETKNVKAIETLQFIVIDYIHI